MRFSTSESPFISTFPSPNDKLYEWKKGHWLDIHGIPLWDEEMHTWDSPYSKICNELNILLKEKDEEKKNQQKILQQRSMFFIMKIFEIFIF